MRCCLPRSWSCQLFLLADLLLFVAAAALGERSPRTISSMNASARLESIEPSPAQVKRGLLHWLFRRQDEESDDDQGDGDSGNEDYDSTTTVVVTSTRSSNGNSPTSGRSDEDSGGDDEGGGNTSQTAWIIAGSGVGALALIGGIFYFATKDKDLNWMDLLTANKDSQSSEMREMNIKPPPSQMPMGGSGFGGGMPPPPPGDPFGGAGSQPPMGPMPPDAPYFDPTGFQNQPVPQPGTFAPQFPPAGPPPPQQMGPPFQGMGGSARSGSSSASSSSSSKSSKRRGGGYEKSAFSGATSNTYDPTVHHDRPHSPDKSQFFAPSEGAGGYAVTSVSRMFDVHGNRINQPKFKGKVTGPNDSVKNVGSDSGSGYGMMRSRTGTPASMSSISKGVRRLSGGSGASSFKSGKTGRTAGTSVTGYSWAGSKDDDSASNAPTSVSRNKPRRFGSKEPDASSFTGRSFSSSRLAPRSLGRSVPLSSRSGGNSARRGGGGSSSRDDSSAISDESWGSGGRSLGSSALTSRTAGTRMGAPGSSALKSSGFGSQSGFKNKGLMLSNSDFEASRSGLTSSAGFGRAGQKGRMGLSKIPEKDDDDESGIESLLEPSSRAGPTSSAARRYIQGGAAVGKSEALQSSGFGSSSAPGRNITLTPSDLTYATGSSKLAGSGLTGTGQTRR